MDDTERQYELAGSPMTGEPSPRASFVANVALSVQLGLLAISLLMVVSMWIVQSKSGGLSGPGLVDPKVAPRWCLTASLAMLVAGILLAVQLASASWREGRSLGLGVTMAGLAGVGFAWGSPKDGVFWVAWVVLGWSATLTVAGLSIAILAVQRSMNRSKSR
ncbi:MAG: hypothetical protein AB7Q00_13820 [Phycisphaerales bacterium]